MKTKLGLVILFALIITANAMAIGPQRGAIAFGSNTSASSVTLVPGYSGLSYYLYFSSTNDNSTPATINISNGSITYFYHIPANSGIVHSWALAPVTIGAPWILSNSSSVTLQINAKGILP
jgi:hypothetical protein